MIEPILYDHLRAQAELASFLTTYAGSPAIFNQEAPADTDPLWAVGAQYGRIVFYVNMGDDPERSYSGTLGVDIYCQQGKQEPETLEALIRPLLDGYFFSDDSDTLAAQWRDSSYFSELNKDIVGVTLSFALLAFPLITTENPNPVDRFNRWTKERFPHLYVIGHDELPPVWKPSDETPAVYWRVTQAAKCSWIPDTWQTDWQTATLQGHVLAPSVHVMAQTARDITTLLTAEKRILRDGEAPMMTERNNRILAGADPMKQGQITCEATYGIIKFPPPAEPLNHIYTKEKSAMPKKTTSDTETPAAEVKAAAPLDVKVSESIYTAEELAAAHEAFGTYREIVAVALRLAGVKTATFDEAKKIVDAFKAKEVG